MAVRDGAAGETFFSFPVASASATVMSLLRRGVLFPAWQQEGPAGGRPRGAVPVKEKEEGKEGEAKEALVDFASQRLKGDLFPDVMEYVGCCPCTRTSRSREPSLARRAAKPVYRRAS
jgi:hypothetical protein